MEKQTLRFLHFEGDFAVFESNHGDIVKVSRDFYTAYMSDSVELEIRRID